MLAGARAYGEEGKGTTSRYRWKVIPTEPPSVRDGEGQARQRQAGAGYMGADIIDTGSRNMLAAGGTGSGDGRVCSRKMG